MLSMLTEVHYTSAIANAISSVLQDVDTYCSPSFCKNTLETNGFSRDDQTDLREALMGMRETVASA